MIQGIIISALLFCAIVPYLLVSFKIYQQIKNKEKTHPLWMLFMILYPVIIIGLIAIVFCFRVPGANVIVG